MKDIITYINEWGGEKMRKPSMKNQLEMLRKALNDNKDLDLAFEYDYIITNDGSLDDLREKIKKAFITEV